MPVATLGDGSIVERTAGTPQGGVISPLLAHLFLHYAFDAWMAREFLLVPDTSTRASLAGSCRISPGVSSRRGVSWLDTVLWPSHIDMREPE